MDKGFIQDIENSEFYGQLSNIFGNPVVKLLLVVLLVWIFKKFGMVIVKRAVRRSIRPDAYAHPDDERQREDTVIGIIDALMKVVVIIVAGALSLSALGVEFGPLLASASVVGVALGFGAQSLIKDFTSGLFIIIENQYRVGDIIEVAGVSGMVERITMRQTVLRDLDGKQHHIPNGAITVATNMSMEFSNVNIKVGVSYDTDLDIARKVINEVGKELAERDDLKDMIIEAPHFMRVDAFGASEVTILVLGKVTAGDQWQVAGEYRLALKKAFDKAKIEIPFQQVVVHKPKSK